MSEPTHGSVRGDAPGGLAWATDEPALEAPRPRTRAEIRAARRAAAPQHRHPWIRRGLFGVSSLVVVSLVLGLAAYVKLNGNINRVDITAALGDRPSQAATTDPKTKLGPLNIMVMGSDIRGDGTGKISGARSDTNVVVHLSADRKSAIVVSIPRDSMTKAPRDCKNTKDKVADGVMRQWNANFTLGGPACVIRTFEGLTGVYIDHFVVIDFRGFQSMVDALGGVTVCTPEAIHDDKAHLDLPAGRTKVNGKQALGYVRVRKSVGDGSDLGRIDRQQAFMSSVVQEATKSSLLLRPDRLFRFLNAATGAMTTDKGLDIGEMKDIAQSLAQIGTDQIRFVRLPTEPYPPDTNRVQWTDAADAIWESMREDKPLPGTKAPSSEASSTPSATTTEPLSVSPNKVHVRVVNDSGVPGVAKQAAEALAVQGFKIEGYLTGTGKPTKGAVVRYGPGLKEEARTLAAAFPGAKIREDELVGNTLELSLGLGSPQAVEVPNRLGTQPLPKPTVTATAPSTQTETIKARTANEDICS